MPTASGVASTGVVNFTVNTLQLTLLVTMSTETERRRVYITPNRAVVILGILLWFVVLYPVVEWNVDCPVGDLNESCIFGKHILWEAVALLSLYHGDGIQVTDSIDERESKNIFPLMMTLIAVLYFSKSY